MHATPQLRRRNRECVSLCVNGEAQKSRMRMLYSSKTSKTVYLKQTPAETAKKINPKCFGFQQVLMRTLAQY